MKQTILCIDDTQSNLFTLRSVLESASEEAYDIVMVETAMDGLDVLLRRKVDIILLDVMMPEIDGFEAAKMIKSNKKTKKIPIIFLTAKKDDDTIETCFYAGDDYISKPFNRVELLARISFHLRLRDRELEVQIREKELTREASFDSLTQIYNRKMFHKSIKRKIVEANFSKNPFTLILFDIDFFKKVNDVYGHLVGDDVLKQLAIIVKGKIRDNDVFARWGGEEFALVFDVDIVRGLEIAQHLREHIQENEFESVGKITCSFGVTQFREDDSIDTITKRADVALYDAKEKGRNRVCQA